MARPLLKETRCCMRRSSRCAMIGAPPPRAKLDPNGSTTLRAERRRRFFVDPFAACVMMMIEWHPHGEGGQYPVAYA